jgi:putative endonuclease
MSRAAGARWERLAAQFLVENGFTIVATNWTCRGGELDLVCDHRGTTVFVEVRSRKSASHGTPGETVGGLKQRRLIHAARMWLAANGGEDRACRFDVVAITVEDGTVEHFENAFTT